MVALIEDGYSPTIEYLEALDDTSKDKMKNLIIRMGDYGIIHNEQLFRHLGNHIYEFKVHHPRSARIFCFFDRHIVICTHGKDKPAKRQLKREIQKAIKMKDCYLKERSK